MNSNEISEDVNEYSGDDFVREIVSYAGLGKIEITILLAIVLRVKDGDFSLLLFGDFNPVIRKYFGRSISNQRLHLGLQTLVMEGFLSEKRSETDEAFWVVREGTFFWLLIKELVSTYKEIVSVIVNGGSVSNSTKDDNTIKLEESDNTNQCESSNNATNNDNNVISDNGTYIIELNNIFNSSNISDIISILIHKNSTQGTVLTSHTQRSGDTKAESDKHKSQTSLPGMKEFIGDDENYTKRLTRKLMETFAEVSGGTVGPRVPNNLVRHVNARLAEGWKQWQIFCAVEGVAYSPWHHRHNQTKIFHAVKSYEAVERGIYLWQMHAPLKSVIFVCNHYDLPIHAGRMKEYEEHQARIKERNDRWIMVERRIEGLRDDVRKWFEMEMKPVDDLSREFEEFKQRMGGGEFDEYIEDEVKKIEVKRAKIFEKHQANFDFALYEKMRRDAGMPEEHIVEAGKRDREDAILRHGTREIPNRKRMELETSRG